MTRQHENARRVRVLVVDDSPAQRQMLVRLLETDPQLEVVGHSSNGAEALRALERLQPDVITLDDRMPVMSGLEAARRIMRERPTPIVMVSAAAGEEAHELQSAALAAGVLAFQSKQALWDSPPGTVSDLARLTRSMAAVRLVRRRFDSRADAATPSASLAQPILERPITPEVVAIGASTGGPQALREIVAGLPPFFPLPIVVVQHTTAGYSNNLVQWLRAGSRLPVHLAEDGQRLDIAGVYIAPTGRHLAIHAHQIMRLVEGPPVSLHCPSATVLFSSMAAAYGPRAIGVLLTGMGNDGAAGLREMKEAGAVTIAQDESSSVVFGMPAEAIRMGAADHVLAPNQIAAVLLDQVARRDRAA